MGEDTKINRYLRDEFAPQGGAEATAGAPARARQGRAVK